MEFSPLHDAYSNGREARMNQKKALCKVRAFLRRGAFVVCLKEDYVPPVLFVKYKK